MYTSSSGIVSYRNGIIDIKPLRGTYDTNIKLVSFPYKPLKLDISKEIEKIIRRETLIKS